MLLGELKSFFYISAEISRKRPWGTGTLVVSREKRESQQARPEACVVNPNSRPMLHVAYLDSE